MAILNILSETVVFILVQTRTKNRRNRTVSQNEGHTLRKHSIFIKFKVNQLACVCSIPTVQMLEKNVTSFQS